MSVSVENSVSVEDSWETSTRVILLGENLNLAEKNEILSAINQQDICNNITLEQLNNWPEYSDCPFQDLTLYTHTNKVTGDKVFYWNYGLGDNDYGSFHFMLSGKLRDSSINFIFNQDGELIFMEKDNYSFTKPEIWPKPDTNIELHLQLITGLIKFYQRVEDADDWDLENTIFDRKYRTPVNVLKFPRK